MKVYLFSTSNRLDFDFQHLEDADQRMDAIADMVRELDEEQQRTVYKIVRAFRK